MMWAVGSGRQRAGRGVARALVSWISGASGLGGDRLGAAVQPGRPQLIHGVYTRDPDRDGLRSLLTGALDNGFATGFVVFFRF